MTSSVACIASATQAKRGLKAILLGAPFADSLAAVNAAFGDGLDTPALRRVTTAELTVLAAELPSAEILLVQSRPTTPGTRIYEHTLSVRFYAAGSDPETIADVVERYVLACRELFLSPDGASALFPFLGGTATPETEDFDPTARLKHNEPTLVKVGSIELTVRTVS